jgi:cell division protein FtsQ
VSRGRLLLRLATVVAVVLALSMGLSIFFKVETITVSGAQKYDPWTIKEASGIQVGDNLLSFGEAKAAGKIRTALPYVYSVRIGIKLPDTVNIEIKELDVVYAIRDAANQWWLISATGRVVEKSDNAAAGDCTQILGVQISNPAAGEQAVAYEAPQDATGESGQTLPVTVTGAQRLETALQILQYLENNGIIGEAATVDVESLGNLELWYGQRFQVLLGDTSRLEYKIQCMNAVINGKDEQNSLKEYDSGVLDITFSIKEDQVIYQAFE